ncbi:MAG: nucleotidyltransferase family protein [Verrucomicrobiota bacterium]
MPEPPAERPVFGTVLLAAGSSTRMGRAKALLPWGGSTVLGHAVATWRAAGVSQLAIVIAAGAADISAELDRLDVPASARIENPAPGGGMWSSVQTAADWTGWNPALTHWMLALLDQPLVRTTTLRALMDAACGEPNLVWQPEFSGRRCHPVVLPRREFLALRRTKAATLREFLEDRVERRAVMPTDDAGVSMDMDTPADYERLARAASFSNRPAGSAGDRA